jgi:hypothetical protein
VYSPAESGWKRYVEGGGALESGVSFLRFVVAAATSRQYSDAQIDDYQGLPRHRFPCSTTQVLDNSSNQEYNHP